MSTVQFALNYVIIILAVRVKLPLPSKFCFNMSSYVYTHFPGVLSTFSCSEREPLAILCTDFVYVMNVLPITKPTVSKHWQDYICMHFVRCLWRN